MNANKAHNENHRPVESAETLFDLDRPTDATPVASESDDLDTRLRRVAQEGVVSLPKRFYEDVAVAVDETAAANAPIHTVTLDGRPVRTPLRRVLGVKTRTIADAMADEWRAQDTHIDPQTMPLTRLANTAIDGVADNMDRVREEIVQYAGSDLLCYRADSPEGLVAMQIAHWYPVLSWVEGALGVTFARATGIMPVTQPDEVSAAVRARLADHDAFKLAALHMAMTLTGSTCLALGVEAGELTADAAWVAAHVDEDWQISQWGEDAEAAARRAKRWRDFEAACHVLQADTA